MIISCARCMRRGPEIPENVLVEDRDQDITVAFVFVPTSAGFFPAHQDGPPRLVCAACATDVEVNSWILSPAHHGVGTASLGDLFG